MTTPIDRWCDENEAKDGPYAAFVGFEKDIKARSDSLAETHEAMEIADQVALFGLVCDLTMEGR